MPNIYTYAIIIGDAMEGCRLDRPSSVVGTSDDTVKLFQLALKRAAEDAVDEILWPQLIRTHTFTTSSGERRYPVPEDFERMYPETQWNATDKWPLLGPLEPRLRNARLYGIVTSSPRNRFAVFGYPQENQIWLDPEPGADSETITFDYISNNVFLPAGRFAATTAYNLNDWILVEGNRLYKVTTAGTSGATAPPATENVNGTEYTNGTVGFTYQDRYPDITADSDQCTISHDYLIAATKARFLRSAGQEYQSYAQEAQAELRRERTKLQGAPRLSLSNRNTQGQFPYLTKNNIPDTGFG